MVEVRCIPGGDREELPGADAIVIDVSPQRGVEIAHDAPDLHRLGEDGLALRAILGRVLALVSQLRLPQLLR